MKRPRRAGIFTFATDMEEDCHQRMKALQDSCSNEVLQPVCEHCERSWNWQKCRSTAENIEKGK